MKNRIKTGVCLFAVILSLMLSVTVTVIAYSGHGGSTQVIARIEQPSTVSSEEPTPEPESSAIPDDEPVSTGDPVYPIIIAASVMISCAAIILIASEKNRKHSSAG